MPMLGNAQTVDSDLRHISGLRISGSNCKSIRLDVENDKPWECNHVTITGFTDKSSGQLNFHFDNQSESSGVTYIVESPPSVNEKGYVEYSVIAYYLRGENGKISQVHPGQGNCQQKENDPDNVKIACILSSESGFAIGSAIEN
jgi:hypothetical protein